MLQEGGFHDIRFRWIQPMDPIPSFLKRILERCIGVLQAFLDRLNILLPDGDRVRLRALRRLGSLPKMSTLAIGFILSECVARMPEGSCFLNIGVWHGYSLFSGMAANPEKTCIGVDSFVEFDRPKAAFFKRFNRLKSSCHSFYALDWREYVVQHHTPVGVFFYDAVHDQKSQYDALCQVHPFIISGGIVIVDDWNWEGPRKGTEQFLRDFPMYDLLFEQRTSSNCHPTFWNGLVMFRKRS